MENRLSAAPALQDLQRQCQGFPGKLPGIPVLFVFEGAHGRIPEPGGFLQSGLLGIRRSIPHRLPGGLESSNGPFDGLSSLESGRQGPDQIG